MNKETKESESIKYDYNFIQFYQNDISSSFTQQLLSLKQCLKTIKMKTKELCEIFFRK